MDAPADRAPRIFISYARADGEALARDLHARLTAEGLTVWLDRAGMEGGRDWWEQITGMLRSPAAQHLVLVLTPAAAASRVVRREWHYARQQGVRVTPVIYRTHKPDRSTLPQFMQRAHSLDPSIDEDWWHLVGLLKGPSNEARVPFMAGDFPAGFVPRPAAYETLKQALLDTRGDAVAITAALRGAGGFGKTTLARALCHDDDIQDAFHHGVLWTTLGEAPGDVVGRLNTLTRALDPKATLESDLDLAIAEWRKALDQRRCLIVIDDVWRAGDLKPFLQGGAECARLVTTRDDAVLGGGAVARVPVDAMAQDEAVALLARDFSPDEVLALHPRLVELAETLGEWPLLLDLANARLLRRVGKGERLAAAVDHAEEAVRRKGIAAFDATNPEARNAAAARSLDLSIEALAEDEGKDAVARLEALGVFVEDADVPLALATALWEREAGLEPFDGDELLDRIAELSFFVRFHRGDGALRLHDVVRARLRQRLGPERLRALDGLVAEVMRDRAGADWAALGQDPYAIAHQPTHLWGAGDEAALDALLTDVRWLGAVLDAHRATGSGCAPLIDIYGQHARSTAALGAARMLRSFAHELMTDGARIVAPLLIGSVNDATVRQNWRVSAVRPALMPIGASLAPPAGELLRFTHGAGVTSVAISSDGLTLATGSADTAHLWDLAMASEIARLEGHEACVWSLVFSPDGAQLATGSPDRTARLWDISTRREIARLEGHDLGVTSVAFSPNGMQVATGSGDRRAQVWDVATGQVIAKLKGHGGWVTSVAFSPDGTWLATGSGDRTARLWDTATGREIVRLEGHGDQVTSVAFSPDGSRIATGSKDRTVRLWDLASGREIAKLEGHWAWITSVAFSPDGSRIATGSGDRTARLWNLTNEGETGLLTGHGDLVRSLVFSPDGKQLATGSGDGTARLWNLAERRQIVGFDRHGGRVRCVAFSPDGAKLATASSDRTARVWDLETGLEITLLSGHKRGVTSVAFSPDGSRLATGSGDRSACLWDVATGQLIAKLEGHGGWVTSVAFAPDGKWLATGSDDRMVRLWDPAKGRAIARLGGHGDVIRSVAFSPNGTRLATGSEDRTARLWDLAMRSEIARFEGHEASVTCVGFSPDGGRLATASDDRTARLWDLAKGQEIASLDGHDASVTSVAFSSDAARLATGSDDRTVRLWDLATGQEIARLPLGAVVASVAVRHGGTIAVGDATGRWHLLEPLE